MHELPNASNKIPIQTSLLRSNEGTLPASPQDIYEERISAVSLRYSRRKDASYNSLGRPTWLGHMAIAFAEIELQRRIQESVPKFERVDPASWAQSKFRVVTEYLKVHSPDEVRQFEAILKSLTHFRPGFGFSKFSPEMFSNDIAELVTSKEIDPQAIAEWFDVVGGLASINTALLSTIFTTGREIQPDAGLRQHEFRQYLEAGINEEDLLVAMKTNKNIAWNEGLSTFDNLKVFAEAVANNFAARTKAIGLPDKEQETFNLIAAKALDLAKYLDELQGLKKHTVYVGRPIPPKYFFAPIAAALSERLQVVGNMEECETVALEISEKLLGAIRRSRIALTKDGLMSLMVGFMEEEFVKKELLPLGSRLYVGKALEVVDKLNSRENADQIKKMISGIVIPALVLQIRSTGNSTFTWKQSDYSALGLTRKLWEKHQKSIGLASKAEVPGLEALREGDTLFEYFGQFQPPHVGHLELLREVSGLTRQDLIECGFLDQSENTRCLIGISVNKGNPQKSSTEWSYEVRRQALLESIRGLRGAFIWPEDEVQGPTLTKLTGHLDILSELKTRPSRQIRVCGTDKLGTSGKYEQIRDGDDAEKLNNTAHIFALLSEDLANPWVLIQKLRLLYDNFPNALILVGAIPEVHSSAFRQKVRQLNDSTLSTLVHPGIMETVRSYE